MGVMNVFCCVSMPHFLSSLLNNPSFITTMDISSSVVDIAYR